MCVVVGEETVITCPNCSYENTDNAKICTRCGELLISPASTHIIDDAERGNESNPKYGSVRFNKTLRLAVLDGETQFEFDRDDVQELVIGRRDPDTGEFPQIDLTPENANKQGVSRKHAVIVRREGALHIRDNNSSNGTFLNGQRLIEDRMRVLRDGDDIRVGNLILRVTFA